MFATIASQDFGQSPIGGPSSQTITVPTVTPGQATFSLRYSIDFSLGVCTPSSDGCSLQVTFYPTKPGLRQDAVIVKDANGRVAEEILLHGIGLGPLPVFSPALATLKASKRESDNPPLMPSAIASQPNGTLIVAVPGSSPWSPGSIYEFDPAANELGAVPGLAAASNLSFGIFALATDAAGNIYYGNGNSEIHRFDVATETDSLIAGNVNPVYMIVDPSGAILYTQQDRVFKIAANANAPVVIAGNGTHGYSGDNGPALQAALAYPAGISLDLAGNLYIADSANERVRKINTSGIITTVAGTGVSGDTGDGGPALNAELYSPSRLVSDAAGDLYVYTFPGKVRRIDAGTGLISTVAGANPQTSGLSTQKNPFLGIGFPGPAQSLAVTGPITLDPDGNLWSVEFMYPFHGIYEISSSAVPFQFPFTIAGQSRTQTVSLLNAGTADLIQPVVGTTDRADFSPSSDCSGLVSIGKTCNVSVVFTAGAHAAPAANITVSDNALSSPQTIPVSGVSGGLPPTAQQMPVTPVGASSPTPHEISVQFAGNASGLTAVLAYGDEFTLGSLSCSGIGTISCTVPVTFTPLYPGLRHDAIQFLDSSGAVVYQCFLTGTGQGAQWFIDPGVVGSIQLPDSARLSAIDAAGNLYATAGSLDSFSGGQIFRFDRQTNQWVLIAGQQIAGNLDTGDGGPGTSATLRYLNAVALDHAGNLFIAETFATRRIDARTGIITTVAQQGGTSIAVDRFGYVYILSSISSKVLRLDPSTGAINDFAGNGYSDSSAGDGGPATSASLYQPAALAFDNNGDLLISEDYRIRKVNVSSGIITTYAEDTCGASSISVDAAGDLFLPCGELKLVPAGGGTSRFVETKNFYNILGPMFRDAAGTFYTSGGLTFSPTFPSTFNMSAAFVNGSTSSATVELMNTGNATLAVHSIALSGAGAAAFSETNNCQSLAPTQNCLVNLTFTPREEATFTAGLNISSTLPDLDTTLNGAGIFGSIDYLPAAITFGSAPVDGVRSASVFLRNSSNYILPPPNISITGPNASDFAVQSDCQQRWRYYQQCEPSVFFHPSAPGTRTATLTITDNTADSPQTISLSGTAFLTQYAGGSFTLPQGASIDFGAARLVMQDDGNLVLYWFETATWSTGTYGQNCGENQCFAAFQGDGNFVVYNGSTPLWSSGTYGNPSAQLVVSAYAPQLKIVSNQSILWTNAPIFQAGNLTLPQGASVNLGSLRLVMQGDGNLVLYRQDGTPVWNTGTYGQDCGANQCLAAFQGDGNFVVYNGATPLWNSGTYGNPAAQLVISAEAPQLKIVSNQSILWTSVPTFQAGNLMLAEGASVNFGSLRLVMQGDGNLVLYRQDGTTVWNTGTYGQVCAVNHCKAVFQEDGNFVVYNGSTPLWNSGTYGNPSGQLVLSPQAPQLKITGSNQFVFWTND